MYIARNRFLPEFHELFDLCVEAKLFEGGSGSGSRREYREYQYYGNYVQDADDDEHLKIISPVVRQYINNNVEGVLICDDFPLRPLTLKMLQEKTPAELEQYFLDGVAYPTNCEDHVVIMTVQTEGIDYNTAKKKTMKEFYKSLTVQKNLDGNTEDDDYDDDLPYDPYDLESIYFRTITNKLILVDCFNSSEPFEYNFIFPQTVAAMLAEAPDSVVVEFSKDEFLAKWMKSVTTGVETQKASTQRLIDQLRDKLLKQQSELGRYNMLLKGIRNNRAVFEGQIDEIKAIPGVTKVELTQDSMHITTDEVRVHFRNKEYYLGIYEIKLDVFNGKCKLRNIASPTKNYTHPHGRGTNLCLGGYSGLMGSCLEQYDYHTFVLTVLEYLRNVSPEDYLAADHILQFKGNERHVLEYARLV